MCRKVSFLYVTTKLKNLDENSATEFYAVNSNSYPKFKILKNYTFHIVVLCPPP
jgi:hypothetical protein